MLLHDFTYVDLPRELVRRRLVGAGTARLTALAALAAVDGDALGRRIDPSTPGPALGGETMVDVGEPQDLGAVTLVPLVWRAARAAPPLAAVDLELAPLGPTRTQLTLLGRAPETVRGPAVVHRRVVQATMRSFLLRLARDLAKPAVVAGGSRHREPLPLAG